MIAANKVAQIFSVNGSFKPTKASAYLLTNLLNNGTYFNTSSQTVIDSGNFSSLSENGQRIFYTDSESGYSGSGYLVYPSSIFYSADDILSSEIDVSVGTSTLVEGVPNKKIRVLGWYVTADAQGEYSILSFLTPRTGTVSVVANGGVSTDMQITCGSGEDLRITAIGCNLKGFINYIIIDDSYDTNNIYDSSVNASANSTTTLVSGVANKMIQVTGWYLVASSASGTYTLKSGATAKTGDIPVGLYGGTSSNIQITCGIGEDLNITTVNCDIDGVINYRLVDSVNETLDEVISVPAGSVSSTVISGVAGKKIKITGWSFGSSGVAGTYKWLSSATDKTGAIPTGAYGGSSPEIQILCSSAEDANMTTVGANIEGVVNYILIDDSDNNDILDAVIDVSAGTTKILDGQPGQNIRVVGWYIGASVASGTYSLLSGTTDKTGDIPMSINGEVSSDLQIKCESSEDLNIRVVNSDLDGVINYKIVNDDNSVYDKPISVPAGSSGSTIIPSVPGKGIKVTGWHVGASVSNGSYKISSSSSDKTADILVAVNGGVVTNSIFVADPGEDINMTTVDSDIDGIINYSFDSSKEDFNIMYYPIRNNGDNEIYVRIKDINGIGFCDLDVYLGSEIQSIHKIIFSGLDWEWHSLGSISISNENIYNLGIRLYTTDIAFDQIVINPDTPPSGSSALTLTESPYITAHMGIYTVDSSLRPDSALYIHDYKTTLDEIKQDGWYNFDLNFVNENADDDFLDSYALYFSTSGANNKNFITWERTEADAYSLEPSAYDT